MSGTTLDYERFNQRLRHHWRWTGVFLLMILGTICSMSRPMVADMGGIAHIRHVGLSQALSEGFVKSFQPALGGQRPSSRETRNKFVFLGLHVLLMLIAAEGLNIHGRRIDRLVALRRKVELDELIIPATKSPS
ncbi:MAG: hypothetical protein ABFE07_01080 [Armatimonadia bacterium]